MSIDSLPLPKDLVGRLIAVTQLQAKPGKEAQVESLLKAIRENSANEAGTEIYRISKSTDGLTFLVYQEYSSLEAGKEHFNNRKNAPESLKKALEESKDHFYAVPPQLQYFEEIH